MSVDLYDELLQLIDTLESRHLDYALCGGIAVALHGYARFTKDIDLLIRQEDLESILNAVDSLGFSHRALPMTFGDGTTERTVQRVSKLDKGDLLTLGLLLTNPRLQQVWNDREVFEWQGRQIQAVSADGLALMKRIAGRDQDLLDLKKLGLISDDE